MFQTVFFFCSFFAYDKKIRIAAGLRYPQKLDLMRRLKTALCGRLWAALDLVFASPPSLLTFPISLYLPTHCCVSWHHMQFYKWCIRTIKNMKPLSKSALSCPQFCLSAFPNLSFTTSSFPYFTHHFQCYTFDFFLRAASSTTATAASHFPFPSIMFRD